MAQLVARLVRNEKVGGSNPPSSTTGRHPIAGVGFCMPGRWCGACCCGDCDTACVPGAVGPGRPLPLWAYRTLRVAGGRRSAPLALRPASFARRVGSKLGQALPQHLWSTPNNTKCPITLMSFNPRPIAPFLSNLARNSPVTSSNIEFASLEL